MAIDPNELPGKKCTDDPIADLPMNEYVIEEQKAPANKAKRSEA